MPSDRLLYSVNPYIKLLVQQQFFGGVHHVWCSESWDSRKEGAYSITGLVPPSSNPCELYHALASAVTRGDGHNEHIARIRAGYLERGARQVQDGVLTDAQLTELAVMVREAPIAMWKPLLYLIHRPLVEDQLVSVPFSERAGLGPEWVVPRLTANQFDLVEF